MIDAKASLLGGRRVALRGMGTEFTGLISNIRDDGQGEAIYTIDLDYPNLTPDGLFVARLCELELL